MFCLIFLNQQIQFVTLIPIVISTTQRHTDTEPVFYFFSAIASDLAFSKLYFSKLFCSWNKFEWYANVTGIYIGHFLGRKKCTHYLLDLKHFPNCSLPPFKKEMLILALWKDCKLFSLS